MSTNNQNTLFPEQLKYSIYGEIHYSQNWNGKLRCKYHTTIRLHNPKKYIVNAYYKIINDKTENYCYDGKIIAIKQVLIDDLPDYTCYLDTGMNKFKTVAMLKNMYSKYNIDWKTQLLDVLLIENVDYENIQAA